jgi:hypothetical protein
MGAGANSKKERLKRIATWIVAIICGTSAARIWYIRSQRITAEEKFRQMQRQMDDSLKSNGLVKVGEHTWEFRGNTPTNAPENHTTVTKP